MLPSSCFKFFLLLLKRINGELDFDPNSWPVLNKILPKNLYYGQILEKSSIKHFPGTKLPKKPETIYFLLEKLHIE